MKFGFCVMADVDEIGFFSHAEALGYDSVWVTDSQMLFSDCYAVLALAAQQTSTAAYRPRHRDLRHAHPAGARGGDGDTEPAGTGPRAPGHRHRQHRDAHDGPAADEDRRRSRSICGCCAALLRGETVDYTYDGDTRPIKMLMRDSKYMSLEPRIPLYVSGFGPRAMALAGEYGDGIVFAIPPRGVPVAEALAHARQGAARRGRDLDGLPQLPRSPTCAAEPGEPVDSERHQGGGRAERDGERLLLLRRGARARHRAAGIPAADLEALLRAGRADTARAPALPHPRIPLHRSAPGRGGTDRRAADPRHLSGRHAGRDRGADSRAGERAACRNWSLPSATPASGAWQNSSRGR